eukprot:8784677-Pyramimonas_sp.AAC.1
MDVPFLTVAPPADDDAAADDDAEAEAGPDPEYVELTRAAFPHEAKRRTDAEMKRKSEAAAKATAKRRRTELDADDENHKLAGLVSHMLR